MVKKKAALFPCMHCQKDFAMFVKWCDKCGDHASSDGFRLGKDICDRCYNGLNDDYIKRKKGSPARIAKFLEKIHKEYGPFVLAPLVAKAPEKMDQIGEFEVPDVPRKLSFFEDPSIIFDWTWPLHDMNGSRAHYDSDIRD